MKKIIISLILAFTVILTLIPCTVVNAQAVIQLGDYVQMGTYYGEPILWRCVAFEKISGYDDKGNPIIDSTDTVTKYKEGYLPLMLSDKIISIKPFDAAGSNTSGSHGRGYYGGMYRREYGSNYWGDSNIRCWLNSANAANEIVWMCGNAPDNANVWDGYNDYADEAGFLTNFDKNEIDKIITVTQSSILDYMEFSNMSQYGSTHYNYNGSIENVVQNANTTAYREFTTDTVFLLDVNQIHSVYTNEFVLGKDYYLTKPTESAVINSEHKSGNLKSSKNWGYWLRTPYPYRGITASAFSSRQVLHVNSGGGIGYNRPDSVYYDGIRPAFFLNIDGANFSYGDGSENNPYAMDTRKIATYRSDYLECNKNLAFYYSDKFFVDSDGYTYNHDLARASLALELASLTTYGYDDDTDTESERMTNINNLYNELGFFDEDLIKPYNYDDSLSDNSDEAAYSFASKRLYDGSTLIAVVVRGGGYGAEWRSNFHVGSGTKHIGFNIPAEEIYQNLLEYLSGYDTNNTKIWITGYSRGAAIANLVSGKINETGLIDRNSLYSYLFAVPNGVIVAAHDANNSIHDNIYNIVLPYDVVPKLALQRWGYGKYGKTLMVKNRDVSNSSSGIYLTPNNELKFREHTGDPYCVGKAQTKAGNKVADILYSLADSNNEYVDTYEGLFMDVVEWAMCKARSQSLLDFAVERYKSHSDFATAATHATSLARGWDKIELYQDVFGLGIILEMNGIDCNADKIVNTVVDALLKELNLFNTLGFASNVGSIANAHHPEYYISWLYGYDNPKDIYETSTYKKLTVACPVDVNVYDSYGDLVASVENNNVVVDILPIDVIGDSAEIYFYDTDDIDDYTIEVTAYDQGVVNYSISEYTDNEVETRKINYSNIPVEDGTTLSGNIPKGQSLEADVYNLTVANNDIETTVEYSEDLSGDDLKNLSVLVTVEGDGTAQDILYATKGELVTLEATPYFDAEFIGWYDENGSLLSTDENYTFVLSENMNVTAKFSKCTAKLVFNEIPCLSNNILNVKGLISAGKNINGQCFIAVYSEDDYLLDLKLVDVSLINDTSYTIDEKFDATLYKKEPFYVKLFLWENMKALAISNSISILSIVNDNSAV